MDALKTLNSELEKLKKTSTSDEEKKSFDKNFDGFQNLFRKYLEADVSAPISWEKIEKVSVFFRKALPPFMSTFRK